jgi:hypothetical protein
MPTAVWMIAACFAPVPEAAPEMAGAVELVDRALAIWRATAPDDRVLMTSPLIRALVDLGRDAEAQEVARAEPQFAKGYLGDDYLTRFAVRLGGVSPEGVLGRIVGPTQRERDLVFGRITRALAGAGKPAAAEQVLPLISGRDPGPRLVALAGPVIAEVYRKAGDTEGGRRARPDTGLGPVMRFLSVKWPGMAL